MNTISAKIVADSINAQGKRITSFLLTYPRFIHSELMTHRVFSRNSASSRAIPFNKMIKMVESDPFIPIAWQSKHTGMQGRDYLDGDSEQQLLINKWLEARDLAVEQAKLLDYNNVTKQLCNRLLEPYMWHTVLVTATEYENFFELRCPKYHTPVSGDEYYFNSKKECLDNHSDPANIEKLEKMSDLEWYSINFSQAEIHIQALAESMWDAMNESTPKQLNPEQWHIPFGDTFDENELDKILNRLHPVQPAWLEWQINAINDLKVKIATARCARLSYMTFEGEINYEKDIALHDTLLKAHHMSPFEHCAKAPTEDELNFKDKGFNILKGTEPYSGNFNGWIQYRQLIDTI